MNSNTVILGAATYVVSRHYSGDQATKQELLRGLLAQKLEQGQPVDQNAAHGV